MTRYAFHFDGTRCTGCKTCEMACKDFKDLSVGTAFRKVYEVTLGHDRARCERLHHQQLRELSAVHVVQSLR